MKTICYLVLFSFGIASCSSLQGLLVEPTALETITAVKSILNGSASKAISTLKTLQNGEESLPDELKPVLATLKTLGLEDEIGKVEKAVASASAVAAAESEAIIKDAVKEVKFKDAVAIATGGKNAATNALKGVMYKTVKKRYSEKLDSELSKHDVIKYWPMATSAYNLFAKNKVEGNVSDFLSERAVDAIFLGMAKQEAIIRGDYKKMGDAVVTKVMDYYTQNKKTS